MDLQELSRKHSQTLRNQMTKEERHLWYDFLKNYPVQFKRQQGYEVLRISNLDVMRQFRAVCETIDNIVNTRMADQ